MADTTTARRLTIDDTDYLLDGEPHQIISGSMTYFRFLPEQWEDRLTKLAALGANTLEVYVPWNLHEPRQGTFDFEGRLDLVRHIEMAGEAGLDVLLRPGPYICAEWDFGGLPWWLNKEDDIDLRCSCPKFLGYVDAWWAQLIPKVTPLLSTNGGPIIACQIENEYGYYGNDHAYLEHLRDKLRELGVDTLIFTSDGTYAPHLQANGGLDDCLRTANFGSDPETRFAQLRKAQPRGPMSCMEFWVGWYDTWGKARKSARNTESVVTELKWMLEHNASVNLFVFCGGTSFGFTSGAVLADTYDPDVTSYDYDGLLSECGDVTTKYYACRDAIAKHTGRADLTKTFEPSHKIKPGKVELTESVSLEDALDTISEPVVTRSPRPIEKLDQGYGYVLYRAHVPASYKGLPLRLRGMHDFAHVKVDGQSIGTWYRNDEQPTWSVEFAGDSAQLDILVDCMGRANFGHRMNERKGITGGVFFGQKGYEERAHFGWECHPLPMDNLADLPWWTTRSLDGPRFFRATFKVDEIGDTYLELPGFTKGFAMVNGFNLGRYWDIGPQHTLYVPAPLLKEGKNELIVFEVVGCTADTPTALLLDHPVWAE